MNEMEEQKRQEIAEKIFDILSKNLSKKEGWEVKRYSDENDFSNLWEEIGKDVGGEKDKRNDKQDNSSEKIIVIWDKFPSDESDIEMPRGIAMTQYITPIDWAIAYSKEHKDKELNIVILDLYTHQYVYTHQYGYEESIRKFHQDALEEMKGWVKFCSFNKKDWGENISSPLDLKEMSFSFNQENKKEKIGGLSQGWGDCFLEAVTKDKSHHSINNILDIIVLEKEALGDKALKFGVQQEALYSSLRCHNIISQEYTKATEDKPNQKDLQNAKIVLIDDMAEQGWEHLLNHWIYGSQNNKNGKIHSEKNADFIIDKLKNLKKDNLKNNRYKLRFTEEEEEKDLDEILLFDLYLFPDDADGQREYVNRVAKLARGLDFAEKLKLKNGGDITEIQDNPMHYLTLLPRLISLIDPSIPIIIFSSTKQTLADDPRASAILDAYKNIRVWGKPAFDNERMLEKLKKEDYIKETKNKFMERIERAIDFIKVRKRLRTLFEYSKKQLNLPDEFSQKIENIKDLQNIQVEMYLDETGSAGGKTNRGFVLGGIYVICLNGDQQENQKDQSNENETISLPPIKNIDTLKFRLTRINEKVDKILPLLLNGKDIETYTWNELKKILKDKTDDSELERVDEIPPPKMFPHSNVTKDDIKRNVGKLWNLKKSRTRVKAMIYLKEILNLNSNFLVRVIKLTNSAEFYPNATSRNQQRSKIHINTLVDVVHIFLHVVLPMLKKEFKSKPPPHCKIKYGTVAGDNSEEQNIRGYYKPHGGGMLMLVGTDAGIVLDNKSVSYTNYSYDNIKIEGLPNNRFSPLHHVADLILDRSLKQSFETYLANVLATYDQQEQQNKEEKINNMLGEKGTGMNAIVQKIQSLKNKYPCMTDNMNELGYFMNANRALYEDGCVKALSILLADSAWNFLKNVPVEPASARLYIYRRLGQECLDLSGDKFADLVEEVKKLNQNNKEGQRTASYSQVKKKTHKKRIFQKRSPTA